MDPRDCHSVCLLYDIQGLFFKFECEIVKIKVTDNFNLLCSFIIVLRVSFQLSYYLYLFPWKIDPN